MATAVIGALRVNLGIDTAQFSDGLGVSQKRLDAFAKKAVIGVTAVGAAATAAAGVLAVGVKKTVDEFNELSRAADVANASVTEFGRLSYAVKSVGIESEKLADIYKDVNDRIGDFWATGGGPMLDFFEQIAPKVGVTAEAFRNLSGPQALQLYYDTLVKAGASQQDLTFYLEAMASDATMLIPLLADGGKRFAELGDQAERLGLVIDQNTAAAAKAFSQNLAQLTSITDGFYTVLTAQLLPVLELASERLISLSEDTDLVDRSAGFLVDSLQWVSNEVGQLAILGARLSTEFAGVAKAFDLIGQGDFSGAWKAFQDADKASTEMAAAVRKEVEHIFSDSISQGAIQRRIDGAFGETGEKAGKSFLAKFEETASPNAFQQLVTRIKESTDAVITDAETVGMTTGAAAAYTTQMDLLLAAAEAGVPITAELQEQIASLSAGFEAATLQLEGARLGLELMNDPFSMLKQELAQLDELLKANAITWEQWSQASTRATLSTISDALDLAGDFTGAMSQIFNDNKELAIASAVINTAAAITKTLAELGATPWGLAAAGVAAATGAAQIATIARTNKGSKTAPSLRGAAGASSGGGAGSSPAQAVSISLQGDSHSTQSVYDLLEQINQATADGHKLIIRRN